MRNLRCLPLATVIGVALVLSACSGGEDSSTGAGSPGPEFERLIDDARFQMREGDLAEAGRLFDKALEIDREDAGLWVDIARLRFRGGEHRGALEAVEYALSLDAQHAPALLMRAQLIRDAFGLKAALGWFESALAIHPENPDLLAEYAATLGDLGRHTDMLIAVRALAEVDAGDARVHYLQAVLAARANDPVLASSLLKRSGMREAGVYSALVLNALIDIQQGNFDTAAATLEQLLESQPGNVRVIELLARALWLNGRDREVVDRFRARAEAPDGSPYLSMLVGRSMERLGQRAEAIPLITRALEGGSGDLEVSFAPSGNPQKLPEPTFALRQAIGAGQTGEAREIAQRLRTQYPGSTDIMVLAGDAAMARSDVAEALGHYGNAAQIRRPWPLTKKIIHAYRLADDWDAADALLIRHLSAEPGNTEALAMYARRAAEDEDWLRVAVLLDTAIDLGAGNDPQLLELRIRAARELNDETKASELEATLRQIKPAPFRS